MLCVPFDDEARKTFGNSRINRVQAIKVYYLVEGRNAWYSVWSQTFKLNSLFDSLAAACAAAELSRKSGSKFYVKQIPALLLQSARGSAIVSEINTDIPLLGYDNRDAVVRVGAKIAAAVSSFNYYGSYWKSKPYSSESVFVVCNFEKNQSYEELRTETLLRYTSSSAGGGYLLNWYPTGSQQSTEVVKRIARIAQSRKQAAKKPTTILHS